MTRSVVVFCRSVLSYIELFDGYNLSHTFFELGTES
jgi:hypothetical protein